MLLLLASDPVAAATVRDLAAAREARPMTIANLPLRAIAATQVNRCRDAPAEPPRQWTPDKDVVGSRSDDCWGEVVTVTAATRRLRPLPGRTAYVGGGENERMRLATAALPYLRAAFGGGAMAVALTGRLMLTKGSRPELNLDLGRGRAGGTSYVTAPEPGGIMPGRHDRF